MSNMMRAVTNKATELFRGYAKIRVPVRVYDYEKHKYVDTGDSYTREIFTGAYEQRGTAAQVLSRQLKSYGWGDSEVLVRRIERTPLVWEEA